MCADFRVSQ